MARSPTLEDRGGEDSNEEGGRWRAHLENLGTGCTRDDSINSASHAGGPSSVAIFTSNTCACVWRRAAKRASSHGGACTWQWVTPCRSDGFPSQAGRRDKGRKHICRALTPVRAPAVAQREGIDEAHHSGPSYLLAFCTCHACVPPHRREKRLGRSTGTSACTTYADTHVGQATTRRVRAVQWRHLGESVGAVRPIECCGALRTRQVICAPRIGSCSHRHALFQNHLQ